MTLTRRNLVVVFGVLSVALSVSSAHGAPQVDANLEQILEHLDEETRERVLAAAEKAKVANDIPPHIREPIRAARPRSEEEAPPLIPPEYHPKAHAPIDEPILAMPDIESVESLRREALGAGNSEDLLARREEMRKKHDEMRRQMEARFKTNLAGGDRSASMPGFDGAGDPHVEHVRRMQESAQPADGEVDYASLRARHDEMMEDHHKTMADFRSQHAKFMDEHAERMAELKQTLKDELPNGLPDDTEL